ncbi:GTP pyrophosphokinase [Bacillus seohaeanensis]|uniref:GTP pyrophosphokinase family protein n=1 Tax=Bacillus seohaeanensis TaxID=284580 RepID=A0ABW5RUX9_9BACI
MNLVEKDIIEWKNNLIIYKFALEEINTKLKILNEEFQFIHKHNPIEHLKSRIKEPSSILKKIKRKNLELTLENVKEHVHDIAGVRITCSFVSDIYDIYTMLEKQDDIRIIKVKDYIQHPKPNGYKSLHLIIEIPVFLTSHTEYVKIEIQIRTIAMDFWASLEHKIYYKFEQDIPLHLQQELTEAAEMVNFLDNKMKNIQEKVEEFKVNRIEKQLVNG